MSRPRLPLLVNGFMGAGKSTVGRLVAARAGVPFVDLDALVEARAGKEVGALFAALGEPAFRALEAEALHTASTFMVGDAVTLADCCLAPQLYACRRFGVDIGDCPTLLRVEANLQALDAYRSSHPDAQPDAQP